MQRHFKVQIGAGVEDIYCNDIDESDPDEVWLIFTDLPPRKFQKAAILSIQEIPIPTPEQQRAQQARWDKIVSDWDIPETYEADE
jgi:hypothetical protein